MKTHTTVTYQATVLLQIRKGKKERNLKKAKNSEDFLLTNALDSQRGKITH